MQSSLTVTYAKYQPNVSFLENAIDVRSENAALVGSNVFSRLSMMTENALKLANILTENQAHCFIISYSYYTFIHNGGFKLSFVKNVLMIETMLMCKVHRKRFFYWHAVTGQNN
jgi:hypothetical protein